MQQYEGVYLLQTYSTCFAGGRLLHWHYDLYQKLQLQFDVFLMMGAIDTRNMYSNFVANKYLHTVASRWIVLI